MENWDKIARLSHVTTKKAKKGDQNYHKKERM